MLEWLEVRLDVGEDKLQTIILQYYFKYTSCILNSDRIRYNSRNYFVC